MNGCGGGRPRSHQHPDRPEILSGQANNILAAVAAGITMEQPYGAGRPGPGGTGPTRLLTCAAADSSCLGLGNAGTSS